MVAATGGATHKVLEVYSGEVITALPQSTPSDVAQAYADARAAQGDEKHVKQALIALRAMRRLRIR